MYIISRPGHTFLRDPDRVSYLSRDCENVKDWYKGRRSCNRNVSEFKTSAILQGSHVSQKAVSRLVFYCFTPVLACESIRFFRRPPEGEKRRPEIRLRFAGYSSPSFELELIEGDLPNKCTGIFPEQNKT